MNNLFGQDVIKSISFDEGEILRSIKHLHCPEWFELDPCYSIGSFYEKNGIPKPKLRFDIKPQAKDVIHASAENLPISANSVKSIMFDPPFIATQSDYNATGENSDLMAKRFSTFPTMEKLWEWYEKCFAEFERVMQDGGMLVFKNQDTISCAKQYFSHCNIMNMAIDYGFYPKDFFILLAKHRIIGGNHQIQYHARKFHCYYWVFEKTKCKVSYYEPKKRGSQIQIHNDAA